MWGPSARACCELCPQAQWLPHRQRCPKAILPCPTRTKEFSKGVSPAKELPEDVVSTAEGEGEFGGPSTGPGAPWSCWREDVQC